MLIDVIWFQLQRCDSADAAADPEKRLRRVAVKLPVERSNAQLRNTLSLTGSEWSDVGSHVNWRRWRWGELSWSIVLRSAKRFRLTGRERSGRLVSRHTD